MKVLECSSKGDKRFSAFYAKVKVYGNFDSIESHYQLSKRFGTEVPSTWKDAKGKTPDSFVANGITFPVSYLTQFYKLLWVKYLDASPSLVAYASQFDEFSDMFKGKSENCQADVIRQYVQEGRASIIKEAQPLIRVLNQGGFVAQVTGDLFDSRAEVIGHQVNCLGIMGGGLADQIKRRYPEVFREYVSLCHEHGKSRSLMGICQIVETHCPGRYVANLFGQHEISRTEVKTEMEALRQSLVTLKEEAIKHTRSVGLPYQLGCGLGGGDWTAVRGLIDEVFSDYPVTIYKLPGSN